MPPACPVVFHARCYYSLQSPFRARCHRLARWSFTLAATTPCNHPSAQDATGLSGGLSRSLLVSRHRASRWHLPPERWEIGFISCEREGSTGQAGGIVRQNVGSLVSLATSVRLHRPSRWHLPPKRRELGFISCEREAP